MEKEILRRKLYKKLTQEQQSHYNGAIEITLNDDEIMTDQQVMRLLHISQRTLYSWRKKGLISFFKIQSRYYYLRTLLYADFIKIYN